MKESQIAQLSELDAILAKLVEIKREEDIKREEEDVEDHEGREAEDEEIYYYLVDDSSFESPLSTDQPKQQEDDVQKKSSASSRVSDTRLSQKSLSRRNIHSASQASSEEFDVHDEDNAHLRLDAPVLWQASDRLSLATEIPRELLSKQQVEEQEDYMYQLQCRRGVLVEDDETGPGNNARVHSRPYGAAWFAPPSRWDAMAKGNVGNASKQSK